MRIIKFAVITFLSFTFYSFIHNEENCGLQVIDSYTQEVMGKNVGFFVKFKNVSKKNIDAFKYKVQFLDGFNEEKGVKEFSWQAGNIIDKLEPGETLKDGSTNWIKGANKIKIEIIRVHFTDDSVCPSSADMN
jgi:hypothetical protein